MLKLRLRQSLLELELFEYVRYLCSPKFNTNVTCVSELNDLSSFKNFYLYENSRFDQLELE